MGDEAIEGSKLGTKLIMFVAIIGLALVAFLVGKNLVNTGVDSMETSVASVNDSRFSDYDKKVVRGRAVKSAIDNFANSEVAIVVCTLKMADANGSALTSENLVNYDEKSTVQAKISGASMNNSAGGTLESPIGINYNALLADVGNNYSFTDESNADNNIYGNPVSLTMSNGYVTFDGDFAQDSSGNVAFDLNTTNITKKGSGEYISDSASFNANLIKNSAGEIIGILFMQKKLY
jgi:hypothetical protein